MNYPLITEYLQSIASSEDNLDQLSHLRPVLDDHGEPHRSSGAFAVVFKMQDPASGKCYAVKCFTEEQSGRAEAYRLIAEELSAVDSPYITAVQYYDKELFVDSSCADESEFPVLLMDWVEGITMEQYIREHHQDSTKMQWLCYRFCRMAAWLRSQALAHGDIKPDNVIVRSDGSLTLVDYDGMFVPAMKGQQSPTLGTRDFSHPERTVEDFDETIDDFALATMALSLKAIALNPDFYEDCGGTDRLLFSADDYRDLSQSQIWAKIQHLMHDKEFATLASQFLAALSQKTLQHLSFRLFNLSKPKAEELDYIIINEPTPNSNFHIQFKDGNCLYFKYDKEDNSKVWVVVPNDYWEDYAQPTGNIIIPCKVAMYQVVEIGSDAFHDCSSLQSIVIPDSVTEIGMDAFIGCSSLQSIVIPDSVTEIVPMAFAGCSSLQSIVIPDSVTKIWWSAFIGCSSLQSIVIPDSVTEIGMNAFNGCSSLQSIIIPDSVTEIWEFAFNDCSSLQSIIVDKSNPTYDSRNNCNAIIETVSNMLIAGCKNTVIPDSVTKIGESAFNDCSSLQTIVIPDSVKEIWNYAFKGCNSLQSIVIPDSVTHIGDSVFSGCSSLQSIVVDRNNTEYDSRNNCNAIIETASNMLIAGCKNTVIPDSVTEIRVGAFEGCSSLQSIIVDNKNPKYDSRNNCNAIIETASNILVAGCKNTIIPDSVTVIGLGAFSGCSSLQSIVIPDSVTKIEEGAFKGCSSLQTIVIPDSVTEIGSETFRDCSSLQTIVIPDSVTEIGWWAFYGCSSLQSIKIKNPKLLERTGVDLNKVKIITD